MRDGLRNLLSRRRRQGEREGTREALESLREPAEGLPGESGGNARKPLARTRGLLRTTDVMDVRARAFARAIAEMIEDDRFNEES
jgi:hypothetical protein